MMAVVEEVHNRAVDVLLGSAVCCYVAKRQHSCLVQPAVGPCSAGQADSVVSTALKHCQQAGVWQLH